MSSQADLEEEAVQAEHDRQAVIVRCGYGPTGPRQAREKWAALVRATERAEKARERADGARS